MKLREITLAALLALPLMAAVPTAAMASEVHGWLGIHGEWHRPDGSTTGYRDACGVWHNPDGTIPGELSWRGSGYRDRHGTWHDANGSVPGAARREERREGDRRGW